MKSATLFLILLVSGVFGGADYVRDRAAATALVKEGKAEEALAVFRKLAEGEASDRQRSDALEQAALLCAQQKRPEEALELARRIPLVAVSKSVQLQLLADHRQWGEIVTQFGQEDFTTWPDMRIGPAAYCRGRAYSALGNGEAAKDDLTMASEYLLEDNTLGLALSALGDTHHRLLKDDDRALRAYRQAYLRRNVYKRCQAALSAADILREQGKAEAALQELAVIPLDQVTLPYWRSRLLMAFGEAFAAAGRTAEATAKYQEALALPELAAGTRKACEEALHRLRRLAE